MKGTLRFVVLASMVAACGCSDSARIASEFLPADLHEPCDIPPAGGGDAALVTIETPPADALCQIAVTFPGLVILRDSSSAGTVLPREPVAMDGRGRLYTRIALPGRFAVWDERGRLLRVIGLEGDRAGDGDGDGEEAQAPANEAMVWVDPMDTIHVQGRDADWMVYSPELNLVRRLPDGPFVLPGVSEFLADGRIVTVRDYGSEEARVGLVSRSGEVERIFEDGETGGGGPGLVAPAGGSTFWVGQENAYDFSLRDADSGDVLRRISRSVHGFRPEAEGRFFPHIRDISVDSNGFLWVSLAVLREGVDAGAANNPASPRAFLEYLKGGSDIVIEVLDPVGGRLLGTVRSYVNDELSVQHLQGDRWYIRHAGDFGYESFEILDLSLVKRGEPSGDAGD